MIKNFILLFLTIICFCTSGNAQFELQQIQVGAGLFGQPVGNSFKFSVRGNIGYFFMDRLSLGVIPHYSKTISVTQLGVNQSINNIGGMVYGRYYFRFDFSYEFAVFPEVALGLGTRGFKENYGMALLASAGPGATYFFKDYWAAEIILPVTLQRRLSDDFITDDLTLTPVLGIQYYF